MEKSENSKDKHQIVIEEIARFKELVRGHEKLLEAIGNL